jgi:hypothetical protein
MLFVALWWVPSQRDEVHAPCKLTLSLLLVRYDVATAKPRAGESLLGSLGLMCLSLIGLNQLMWWSCAANLPKSLPGIVLAVSRFDTVSPLNITIQFYLSYG